MEAIIDLSYLKICWLYRIIYVIWQAAAAAKNRFESVIIVYSKAERTIEVSELAVSKRRATL